MPQGHATKDWRVELARDSDEDAIDLGEVDGVCVSGDDAVWLAFVMSRGCGHLAVDMIDDMAFA